MVVITDKVLRLSARLLVSGLVLFELLNQAKILHYTLDFTWIGLVITTLVAWVIIESLSFYLEKSCGAPMAGWAMLITVIGLYIDAGGDFFHFYGQFAWYDQIAHFIGGGAVAALTFSIIWRLFQCQKIQLKIWGKSFFSVATAGLLGTFYEIEEYLEDFFTGSHRLGNGTDTANDMMMNVLGAITIIVIINIVLKIYVSHKSNSRHKNSLK